MDFSEFQIEIDLLLYQEANIADHFAHHISSISSILLIIFFELKNKYNKNLTHMLIFLNENRIKLKNGKIARLISLLVPDFMKEAFIENKNALPEDQGAVAIIFCEISNFDDIFQKEKKNTVYILDEIYRAFDKFCNESHVKKIEVK